MDLSTTYLGLDLAHPIVPSASPLSRDVDTICRMEDAGAPAVVMHSLFEEQLRHESHHLHHYLEYGAESFGEALSYLPEHDTYHVGPDRYLEHIREAKERIDVPVIASLNGISRGGWTEYARQLQAAGADAIELNVYYLPADPTVTGTEVERRYIDIVHAVRNAVSIPLSVKIGPYFSAVGHVARRLTEAGANGLVLFNRFYQPDFDLDTLEVVPHLVLSTSWEMRLPLRWIAILYGRIDADFALTSGVHTYEDVLKALMAGASVTMVASEFLRNGIERLTEMRNALETWMELREYASVRQMQGSMSQRHVRDSASFERANYVRVLHSWRPDPTGRMTPAHP